MSMIIAVDFDGTIARSNYPVIQGEQPYAGEVLRQLHQDGHYIIIWTCRCGKPLLDAVNWLLEHGIPFDRVNDHNPENVARYGEGGNKVYAHVCTLMTRIWEVFPAGVNAWRPYAIRMRNINWQR